MLARVLFSRKWTVAALAIDSKSRPDGLPGLGLTVRVRARTWRAAAALGLLPVTTPSDGDSGESSCAHDGNPPQCGRCCWAFGLL